jgi:tetratricopeptide (TPR) repeat protein
VPFLSAEDEMPKNEISGASTCLTEPHRLVDDEIFLFVRYYHSKLLSDSSNRSFNSMRWRYFVLALGGCLLVAFGVGIWKTQLESRQAHSSAAGGQSMTALNSTPCAIALAPHKGNEKIDYNIQKLQKEARSNLQRTDTMKRLGWAFITKARLSFDPGYYKLGEECALCVRLKNDDDPDALLLQGHILQSLHKFKEAEPVARKLTTIRNEAFDYGLLGDVLMEQGRLTEAVAAYQRMIGLKPDLQSYTRVAHLRWLKGDLEGAIEVMRMATTSGGPGDPEPTAWAYTRLGIYELQAGDIEMATKAAAVAFEFAENYPAALLLRGRILLTQNIAEEAIDFLQRAAALTRLPEYEWTLADAWRETGKIQLAEKAENSLARHGAIDDPRTFALYLATRKQQVQEALKLAQDELKTRADVFTFDTLAWALQVNGRLPEAREYSRKALSEGTQDARLLYHAGCLALAAGEYADAETAFTLSDRIKQMLMPLERDDLEKEIAFLKSREASRPNAVSN